MANGPTDVSRSEAAWREPFPVPLLRLFGFGFGSMPRGKNINYTVILINVYKTNQDLDMKKGF